MKAIVYQKYGPPDVLQLSEVEKPTAGEDEVLLKVHAAAVTPTDWHFMTGEPFLARIVAGGLLSPKNKIPGIEFSGRVESVGVNVTGYKPGDEVFGRSPNSGGYAEYATLPVGEQWLKPASMTFEQAAALQFSAMTALICLVELGGIQSGQEVLINGASGGVGTLAVQIARHFGARVTGVCSTGNLELVRSLGADQVIDYTQKDFKLENTRYDLVFDVAGVRSFADCRRVLKPSGVFITTAFSPANLLVGKWVSLTSDQKMVPMPPIEPKPEIKKLFKSLLEAGKLEPVTDSPFPLERTADAFRYYKNEHTRGRVVVAV